MKKIDLNHPRFYNIIPAPSGEKKYIGGTDSPEEEIRAIEAIVENSWRQVKDVLPHLSRLDQIDYCRNIWAFCRAFPVLPQHPSRSITLYGPFRVWAFRQTGSEFINIFTLCLCLLRAAQFTYHIHLCKLDGKEQAHFLAVVEYSAKNIIVDIGCPQFDSFNVKITSTKRI